MTRKKKPSEMTFAEREAHDKREFRNALRRIKRIQDFPYNTCPASRHVRMMGKYLVSGGYPMLQEEPLHCALSMLATVESLWQLRTKARKAGLWGETPAPQSKRRRT